MKIDPYKHKEKFLNWKEKVKKGIPEMSQKNSDVLLQYITDMENGLNISSKSVKGARSYVRLNNLRHRLISLAKQFEYCSNVSLTEITTTSFWLNLTNLKNNTNRGIQ